MSIENPRANITNKVNRGDHVPSAPKEHETPQWPGPDGDVEFPRQRGDLTATSPETYVVPLEQVPETETRDEKKGFLSKTWGKIAVATAGVAAGVGVFLAGTQHGESDQPAQVPPVATAESQPTSASSTAAPSSTEVAPSTSAAAPSAESATRYNPNILMERRNKDILVISEKIVTPEQAKHDFFTITQAEAPTPEAALNIYVEKALQNGMNINTRAETVTARGGIEAVQAESEEIIESGMLSNLGENHDRVDKAATDDHVLPGTVVWEVNKQNIKEGLETRAKIQETTIQTNAPGNYTARGKLLATSYLKDVPKHTNVYGAQITLKLENGVWKAPKPYTYFTRMKQGNK